MIRRKEMARAECEPVRAWAVRDGFGAILPNTVHEGRVGAMVNWLLTEARVMTTTNAASDEEVEARFTDEKRRWGAELVAIEITEVKQA